MSADANETATQVTCPECGTVTTVKGGGRAASDFCPSCDYPLFWAGSTGARTAASGINEDALYRAPGTSGTTTASAIACPACSERNPSTSVTCLRCGSILRPPPPQPQPPPEAPQPVVVVNPAPIVRCSHWPSWAVATLAATVTLLVTVTAFLLFG